MSLGAAGPEEIDEHGIVAATRLAMVRAVRGLSPQPHHLLVDYLTLDECGLPFTSVTRGDSVSYSIAAAAIVAKVDRDRLMVEANDRWPGYDFHKNKGYGGSPLHRRQLCRLGPTPIHRLTFAPVRRALLYHPRPKVMPSPRSRLGSLGERLARQHLIKLGCRILDTNYRSQWGEVDVVARLQDTILFVEVKTRRTSSFGVPEESITSAKAEKLIATAETYLEEHDLSDSHWRIDLISVEMDRTGRVLPLRHLRNAVERSLC